MLAIARKSGAAGGGAGGCYEDFRKIASEDLNLRVKHCDMQIQLLEDMQRGEYRWGYEVVREGEEAEGNYFFIVPFSEDRISKIWAKDLSGGLQWRSNTEENERTRITIAFRELLSKNEPYRFSFGYETDVMSIASSGLFKTSVTYNDWCSHNNPCDEIKVSINLPSKSIAMNSVPPTTLGKNPIKFRVTDRRPNEYFSFLLNYKKSKLGKQFWFWIAGALVSGIAGAIFTVFFG